MIFARIRNRNEIPFPSARGIWCRCHAVVGAPPCATDTADTRAAQAESGTPANSRHSVNPQAPCLTVHMRSIDFSRPITVSPLGKENGCSGEDSRIITQTGIGPRWRENDNRTTYHYRSEPDFIHCLPSLVFPTRRHRYVIPGTGIPVTSEEWRCRTLVRCGHNIATVFRICSNFSPAGPPIRAARPPDPRWARVKPRTSIRRLPTPCLQFAHSHRRLRGTTATCYTGSAFHGPATRPGHVSPLQRHRLGRAHRPPAGPAQRRRAQVDGLPAVSGVPVRGARWCRGRPARAHGRSCASAVFSDVVQLRGQRVRALVEFAFLVSGQVESDETAGSLAQRNEGAGCAP